jgi:UDP-glucose 4-epimerase
MILITGGAGFIGSHLLLSQGEEPMIVVDDLSQGQRSACLGATLIEATLLDTASLRSVFETYPISAVFHLAARTEAGESVKDPFAFWQANVIGTINLLQEMSRAKVSYIIFSSTAAVYGNPDHLPLSEEHPLRPESPYGDTKLAAERLIHSWAHAYDGKFVILRYFNAAGADPKGRVGERHQPETHLIPKCLDVALGREPGLIINGDDYNTRDGTCIRDFVHVLDLAEAHHLALKYLRNGGSSTVLNLGSETGYSVLEVVREVERVTGRAVPYSFAPRREGDVESLFASSNRAKSLLGWNAQWKELNDILRTAWNWHLQLYS